MSGRMEGVILDLDPESGAIVVYTKKNLRGKNIEAHIAGDMKAKVYRANVIERTINGRQEFSAIFPRIPVGYYAVNYWESSKTKNSGRITVSAGSVSELDWR